MTTLNATIYSEQLMRKVNIFAVIPDKVETAFNKQTEKEEVVPFKTLYLLHGWSGHYMDWVHNSRIVEWAEEYNLAVIMPSGENGFYVDHPHHNNFGAFIGEDLVNVTRQLFPLSDKREDTFIGGLSMGGYGALRNGYVYGDTFSKIVALSSRVLSKEDNTFHDLTEDTPINRSLWPLIPSKTYRDLPDNMDTYALVKQAKNKPELYLACGTDDHLIRENEVFHNWLIQNGFDHEYREEPGDHNWDFWNTFLLDALPWLVEK